MKKAHRRSFDWAAFRRHPIPRWAWEAIIAIGRNNVFGLASQLAYSFLFALFPFLLSIVAVASLLPEQGLASQLLAGLSPFVPPASLSLISKTVDDIVAQRHVALASVSFVVGLWTNSSAIAGLMVGLNQVYGVVNSRSVIVTRALCLGITVVVDLLAAAVVLLLAWGGSAGRFVSTALGRPGLYSDAWAVLRWPVTIALLFGVVVGLYRLLPDLKLKVRDVIWGALAAVLAFIPVTMGFSLYLNHFPDFGAAYGSLGAVIVLLTWLWLNGLLLMLGGQINALIAMARGTLPHPPPVNSSR